MPVLDQAPSSWSWVPSPLHLPQAPAAGAARAGSIELIMGAMFAGKTNALLQRAQEKRRQGLSVLLLKSNKDTRYEASCISSHSGHHLPCREASR